MLNHCGLFFLELMLGKDLGGIAGVFPGSPLCGNISFCRHLTKRKKPAAEANGFRVNVERLINASFGFALGLQNVIVFQ